MEGSACCVSECSEGREAGRQGGKVGYTVCVGIDGCSGSRWRL